MHNVSPLSVVNKFAYMIILLTHANTYNTCNNNNDKSNEHNQYVMVKVAQHMLY